MDLKQHIISLYKDGNSHREVAKMLGLKQNFIQRTLKKENLSRSHTESTTLWHSRRKALGLPGPNQVG